MFGTCGASCQAVSYHVAWLDIGWQLAPYDMQEARLNLAELIVLLFTQQLQNILF